jgi:DNA-binding NtrC family response regulator
VPPLRERRDDIPLLVEELARRVASELHCAALVVTPAAVRRLREYDWPGNVRELENELTRAAAMSPTGVIDADDLVLQLGAHRAAEERADACLTLDDVERQHIVRVLTMTGGNKRRAAMLLKVTRPRFDRLLERHKIVVTQRGQDGSDS